MCNSIIDRLIVKSQCLVIAWSNVFKPAPFGIMKWTAILPKRLAYISACWFQNNAGWEKTHIYLGIVMHLVDVSCVLIAFFSSSNPPVFFSFFTKLLTAFSDHLSTSELSPFFHPNKVLTIGGVNGERVVILSFLIHNVIQPLRYARRKFDIVYFFCSMHFSGCVPLRHMWGSAPPSGWREVEIVIRDVEWKADPTTWR